jgi:Gram-negative bacterial TonB protein C-terminal
MFLITSMVSLQDAKLSWVKFDPPEYPRNAQIAHIEGPVTLTFVLQSGNPVFLKESSGHPLLVPAALESLKKSQLNCIDCAQQGQIFTVVFDFQVASHDCTDPQVPTHTTVDTPTHITVIAQSICTSDPVARYRRTRSIRCLYLWKCARVQRD